MSSITAIKSALATGVSFTEATLTCAVKVLELVPLLSVALNAMLTVPLKLGAATKIKPVAWAGVNGELASTGVTPSARYKTP